MSKFQVGDKVRIANPAFVSGYSLKGTVCTVTEIHDIYPRGNKYTLSVKGNVLNQYWLDGELELVEPATFTKSDIKDGMVVEHKNGDRALILGGRLVYKDGNRRIENFNDDLTYIISPFDGVEIVRVYTVTSPGGSITNIFKDQYLTLIWERKPDYKEMTVEEIEKELGYKIKVIADKE